MKTNNGKIAELEKMLDDIDADLLDCGTNNAAFNALCLERNAITMQLKNLEN